MKNKKVAKFCYMFAMFIYGTIGCFSRYIGLSPGLLVLSRGVIGLIFILGYVLISRKKVDIKSIKDNILWLILGGASLGLNWICLFEAYNHTTVAISCLCNYLAPAIFILVAPLIFKEKLTWQKILCVVVALIGMVFVSGIIGSNTSFNAVGIIFGISAAMFYTTLIIFNKLLKNIDSIDRTIIQLFFASLVMAPYALFTTDFSSIVFDAKLIIFVLILGMFHTGFAYILYFGSMGHLESHTIAIFSYIEPVVSVFLSYVVLKEDLTLFGLIGGVLILGSTLVSNFINKEVEVEPCENSAV